MVWSHLQLMEKFRLSLIDGKGIAGYATSVFPLGEVEPGLDMGLVPADTL